ncbi:MAG: HNH endonuclease family protein [Rhodospirillales bacterium]
MKLKKVARENIEIAESESDEEKKFQSIADALRAELQRSNEATAVWPTDTDFQKSWLSKPIYVKSRIDRCAMVLRALEEAMRTSKTEGSVLQGKLTVEHILPQKGSLEDYPYAEKMPANEGETIEQTHFRILHTIGNLTLLTQELNSSVSNGPYPEKRAEIIEHSDLRLNAWLRKDEKKNWSEADILDRGETLFTYAKDIWPLPTEVAIKVAGEISE